MGLSSVGVMIAKDNWVMAAPTQILRVHLHLRSTSEQAALQKPSRVANSISAPSWTMIRSSAGVMVLMGNWELGQLLTKQHQRQQPAHSAQGVMLSLSMLATTTHASFSITVNSPAGVLMQMANWVTALPRVPNHRFNPQPFRWVLEGQLSRFLRAASTPALNWTMDNSSVGAIEQTVKLAITGISTTRPTAQALPQSPAITTAEVRTSTRASCLLPLLLVQPVPSHLRCPLASV